MTNNQTQHASRNGLSGNGAPGQADIRDDLDAVKGDVSEIGSAAAREARRLGDTARRQAKSYADQQKRGAANTIEDVAQMLREAMSGLENKANLQRIVEHAAATLEDVSESVRSKTWTGLYEDAEAFARRRPLATALGTAAAGLVIARFIKSSAEKSGFARGYAHARDDRRDDGIDAYQPSRYR